MTRKTMNIKFIAQNAIKKQTLNFYLLPIVYL